MTAYLGAIRKMIVPATFAVLLGLYMLFAGEASRTEFAAGLPASVLVAAFVWLQRRGQTDPIRLRAPWHRIVLKPMASLVRDSVRVGGQLLRAIASPVGAAGTIGRQPFRPGGDRATDAGRRALVTLAASFAPNGFVIDVPPSVVLGDAEVLLMHRLAPSPPASDREWPV